MTLESKQYVVHVVPVKMVEAHLQWSSSYTVVSHANIQLYGTNLKVVCKFLDGRDRQYDQH